MQSAPLRNTTQGYKLPFIMLKHIIVVCAFCVLASSALADDTARANRLFVAAVKFIQASEAEASMEKKFELLEKAHSNLTTIIDQFPATDLAVKLISGQKIGTHMVDWGQ